MCRMIAKASVSAASIFDEMMFCPSSLKYLSNHGVQPDDPTKRGAHGDGCGIAFWSAGKFEVHKRGREDFWDETYSEVIRNACSNMFIAHTRLASSGLEIRRDCSHPFYITVDGNSFALCHNGTIYSYKDEAIRTKTADSEIFLREIVKTDSDNSASSIAGRVREIARTEKYSSLCALLASNDVLYAWRIYNEKNPADVPRLEAYYTLHFSFRGHSVLFASEPLDNKSWHLMENMTFISVRVHDGMFDVGYIPEYHKLKLQVVDLSK